ncbi:hypothetical protein [Pseudothermotoga thermarum]|uniref:Uncharacterized protein n=1 Tax=Pseudothermotoga thermarum DSM 5069 TaxID=688269 RepID=F7YUJ1_9THEM|nr:hypothetical protein [Pseudothermotoga thermarum]AEH51462.1 hypothetical protein Theth_1400 [Pseudothermotoga thermarum DSM 5069]
MVILILISCTSTESIGTQSQTPFEIIWERTLADEDELAWVIIKTTDGNYIVLSYAGPLKTSATKLRPNGELVWRRILETDGLGKFAVETSDGGFLILDRRLSFEYDYYNTDQSILFKFDKNGDKVFEKPLPIFTSGYAWWATKAHNGGVVTTGCKQIQVNLPEYDLEGRAEVIHIAKVNGNGEILWEKTYGGLEDYDVCYPTINGIIPDGAICLKDYYEGYPYSITQTSDGGYVVTGWRIRLVGEIILIPGFIPEVPEIVEELFVLKIDTNGEKIWDKGYEEYADSFARIVESHDGNYILITGNEEGTEIVKIDKYTQEIMWKRTYPNTQVYDIKQIPRGYFVLTIYTYDSEGRMTKSGLLKIDSTGKEIDRYLRRDRVFGTCILEGDTIVVVGYTTEDIGNPLSRRQAYVAKVVF